MMKTIMCLLVIHMCSTLEKHVVDSIKYHRRWWRLSQRDLSKGLKWSPNTVQRMEAGAAVITLAQLLQLATFFNESLAEFVSEEWSGKLAKRDEIRAEGP